MTPSKAKGVALAGLAAFVWGTVPIGGTIALGGITSPLLSFVRLTIAALFSIWVVRQRGHRLGRPPLGLVFAGLFLAVNYVTYMWAVERAGPAITQVLIQTAPLFLVLLGMAFLGERPTRRHLAGGAVALGGVVLVSWEGSATPRSALGVALVFLAAAGWAAYAMLQKRAGKDRHSSWCMAWVSLVAAAGTAPVAFVETLRSPDGVQLAAIAYLCMNTVVAYWAFTESLRHIDASLAAVILTLGPVVTLLVLLATNAMNQQRIPHEPFSWPRLLGAALVIGGVALAVSRQRR